MRRPASFQRAALMIFRPPDRMVGPWFQTASGRFGGRVGRGWAWLLAADVCAFAQDRSVLFEGMARRIHGRQGEAVCRCGTGFQHGQEALLWLGRRGRLRAGVPAVRLVRPERGPDRHPGHGHATGHHDGPHPGRSWLHGVHSVPRPVGSPDRHAGVQEGRPRLDDAVRHPAHRRRHPVRPVRRLRPPSACGSSRSAAWPWPS